jgi:hypothetical protein
MDSLTCIFQSFGHKCIIIDMDIKTKKHHHVHTRSYEKAHLDLHITHFDRNQYQKMNKPCITILLPQYGMVPYGIIPYFYFLCYDTSWYGTITSMHWYHFMVSVQKRAVLYVQSGKWLYISKLIKHRFPIKIWTLGVQGWDAHNVT